MLSGVDYSLVWITTKKRVPIVKQMIPKNLAEK